MQKVLSSYGKNSGLPASPSQSFRQIGRAYNSITSGQNRAPSSEYSASKIPTPRYSSPNGRAFRESSRNEINDYTANLYNYVEKERMILRGESSSPSPQVFSKDADISGKYRQSFTTNDEISSSFQRIYDSFFDDSRPMNSASSNLYDKPLDPAPQKTSPQKTTQAAQTSVNKSNIINSKAFNLSIQKKTTGVRTSQEPSLQKFTQPENQNSSGASNGQNKSSQKPIRNMIVSIDTPIPQGKATPSKLEARREAVKKSKLETKVDKRPLVRSQTSKDQLAILRQVLQIPVTKPKELDTSKTQVPKNKEKLDSSLINKHNPSKSAISITPKGASLQKTKSQTTASFLKSMVEHEDHKNNRVPGLASKGFVVEKDCGLEQELKTERQKARREQLMKHREGSNPRIGSTSSQMRCRTAYKQTNTPLSKLFDLGMSTCPSKSISRVPRLFETDLLGEGSLSQVVPPSMTRNSSKEMKKPNGSRVENSLSSSNISLKDDSRVITPRQLVRRNSGYKDSHKQINVLPSQTSSTSLTSAQNKSKISRENSLTKVHVR